jgi:hypothetical protein
MILTIAPPGCRPFEKKPKGRSQTKKTLFVPQRRSEMILPRRPPVNFEFYIFHPRKIAMSKFYNGLHKKYMEQLVFNLKIITN